MERLEKKLDNGSMNKLKANLIDNVSLWEMNDEDLIEIGIIEKGPRKIILRFIERHAEGSDNLNITEDSDRDDSLREIRPELQPETVRSVLEKDAKFHMTLTKQLDYKKVPDVKKLRLMNRILTEHYFADQILKQKRYPTWQEKQELARRIVQEFPHLAETRIIENAPAESYFFWRHGGMEHGVHTGLIETRVCNMRKDVLPENRHFRRATREKTVLTDEVVQIAARIAALMPSAANARQISEGMALSFDLHKFLLQEKGDSKCTMIVEKFPHLLAYEGDMIIQAFDRILQRSAGDGLKMLLLAGLLFDESVWHDVEDEYFRGALRIMKKLSNRGIKRTNEMENMTTDEVLAMPLIQWVNFNGPEVGFVELLAVKELIERQPLQPHILCVADRYKKGNLYVIVENYVIPCGLSSLRAVEVLFKCLTVFGVDPPVLLRKLDDMVAINAFRTRETSKKTTVNNLSSRYQEFLKTSAEKESH